MNLNSPEIEAVPAETTIDVCDEIKAYASTPKKRRERERDFEYKCEGKGAEAKAHRKMEIVFFIHLNKILSHILSLISYPQPCLYNVTQ